MLLYFPLDGDDDRHLLNIPYRSTTSASSDNNNNNDEEGNQSNKGMVILEPQWLVDVFRSIIDHNRQISNEVKGKPLNEKNEPSIIFNRELEELWKVRKRSFTCYLQLSFLL